MEKFIPESVDPYRHAEQDLRLIGQVRFSDMSRLINNLQSDSGSADVDLQFGVDEQGVTYVKGKLAASLLLQCQRCLKPVKYEIMADFLLGIVDSLEDANSLPEHYEPTITKDGFLPLREVIEDEVILNLPIIARHEEGACKVKLPTGELNIEDEQRSTPFHVLASLKTELES